MRGKEKCRALKEIRRQIAEANDISLVISECTYQGECRGTCPKCESELRFLERELAIRQGLGKAVAVVGLSTGVCASMTACSPTSLFSDPPAMEEDLAGDTTLYGEDMPGNLAPDEEDPVSTEHTDTGEGSTNNAVENDSSDTSNTLENQTEEDPENGTQDITESGTDNASGSEIEGELAIEGDIAPYEPADAVCIPDGEPANE
ncbi:MAG: hypothetical protein HDR26_00010 [Lachnospiraceae bacterium]|nr:hypothetical protein [Lachnospiraceae bacterium]